MILKNSPGLPALAYPLLPTSALVIITFKRLRTIKGHIKLSLASNLKLKKNIPRAVETSMTIHVIVFH